MHQLCLHLQLCQQILCLSPPRHRSLPPVHSISSYHQLHWGVWGAPSAGLDSPLPLMQQHSPGRSWAVHQNTHRSGSLIVVSSWQCALAEILWIRVSEEEGNFLLCPR